MRLSEVVAVLDAIAPKAYAEPWDNVGLLAGDLSRAVSRALVTVDLTSDVFDEARSKKCDVIVAYHPPIFSPLKRVLSESLIFKAISHSIAIYSPHTALDVALGGTNDVLADAVGMHVERSALHAPHLEEAAKDADYKLFVFVPEEACEKVSRALFDAGAGKIGNYSSCSFRSAGTGTFFGESGSKPVVGNTGQLESVSELRLETVVPAERVAEVVRALRASHPYEEPAFDLIRVASAPAASRVGLGRVGNVDAIDRKSLLEKIKTALGVSHVLVAGTVEGDVKRVAVAAGACGDLYRDAFASGADLYLTGEMRHHDAIAAGRKITVVCALHSNSERIAMKMLAAKLNEKCSGFEALVSETDRDPFRIS
jgi:dinuclear metal center YbgI/SA1388 family protein